MKKETNELKVLREMILEFNPFYTDEDINNFDYDERFNIIKEIVEDWEANG